MSDRDVVELVTWNGPWTEDDPDANFKREIVTLSRLDPMQTIETMAANIGVPAGAIARYVLARWASEGSAGLLEVGPSMVERLWSIVAAAESGGTPQARLRAFDQLRGILSWLRVPIETDEDAMSRARSLAVPDGPPDMSA